MTKTVIEEITAVLASVDTEKVEHLLHTILAARCIVVHGAGRVGLACKGFAMRLSHLGRSAFVASDSNIPPVQKGDLIIVASSSGETQTSFDAADMAKKHGASIAAISADVQSRIAGLSDILIELKTPTKFGATDERVSRQPMATLFEQSLQILYDILVLMIMEKTGQKHADMWARHTNID